MSTLINSATRSQCQAIKNYLMAGNQITALEALNKFGCFRLGSRIHDLRSEGVPIETAMIKRNSKRIAQYYIPEVPQRNPVSDIPHTPKWKDHHEELVAIGFKFVREYNDEGCTEDVYYIRKVAKYTVKLMLNMDASIKLDMGQEIQVIAKGMSGVRSLMQWCYDND